MHDLSVSPAAEHSRHLSSSCELHASDAQDHALGLGVFEQSYQQLSRGCFLGSVVSVTSNEVTLFRETLNQSVYQTGRSDSSHLTIALAARLRDHAYWNGRYIDQNSVVAFSPGFEFELRTPVDVVCFGFSLPVKKLLSIDPDCSTDGWSKRLAARNCWTDSSPLKLNLTSRLESLLIRKSALAEPALSAEVSDIAEHVMDYLGTLVSQHSSPIQKLRAESYPRIARKARQLMFDRLADPISVSGLCAELGCSRRALQYAFESVFDLNPVAYLRMLRLSTARKLLTTRGIRTTVQDAAAAVGFAHLPRFAQEYCLMYGELPSETLMRYQQQR